MNGQEWKSFAKTTLAGIIGAYPIAYFLQIPIEKYLVLAVLGVSIILVGGLFITALQGLDQK